MKAASSSVPLEMFLPKIVHLCLMYPEPTRRNLVHHNAKVLLVISEEFFSQGLDRGEHKFWKAIWALLIDENEHDSYYGNRFEWLVEELLKLSVITYGGLSRLRDKFFCYHTGDNQKLFEAAWDIALEQFQKHQEYRELIYWFLRQIRNSDWKPRVQTRPSRDNWLEPVK